MTPARRRFGAAALALAALGAGCGGRSTVGEPAARVGNDTITVDQVNQAVPPAQRGLRGEAAEAAVQQALERLVDQAVAAAKAEDQKLDRDPRVQQQLEAARREVLARAWLEKVGEGAARPTPDEVARYHADKPALFSDRRVYNLQELLIEARPDQVPDLRSRLGASRNIAEFIESLRGGAFRFSLSQAVRAAEQLPLAQLDTIARLSDGQASLFPHAAGAQVLVLVGSRPQPVTLEQARPAIELFLANERRRRLAEDEVRALRAAARVERLGRFAATGAAASAPPK